jgi:hypothetical protein
MEMPMDFSMVVWMVVQLVACLDEWMVDTRVQLKGSMRAA